MAFMLYSASCAQSAWAQTAAQNSSVANEINYTYSYIRMVNESAYLVFYPNLTQAYNLAKDANASARRGNTTYALELLKDARDSALRQYGIMEQGAGDAVYVMLALIAATALLMYFIMLPRKRPRKAA